MFVGHLFQISLTEVGAGWLGKLAQEDFGPFSSRGGHCHPSPTAGYRSLLDAWTSSYRGKGTKRLKGIGRDCFSPKRIHNSIISGLMTPLEVLPFRNVRGVYTGQ